MRVVRLLLCVLVCLAVFVNSYAQHTPQKDRSIFWQITKPGLSDTSYLFGTLHLLEKSYVDTMPSLMRALGNSELVVGEIVVDSSIKDDLLSSSMTTTPLTKVMSKKNYEM